MTTSGNKPEGTITSLPGKGAKGAPDTFDGDYRDIDTFLDHFETLCAEKNVIKGEYKCKGLVRYCSRTIREALTGLKSYTDQDYDEFRKDFIYYFDKDREKQRFRLQDLYKLARKWKDRKIDSLATFKKYHLQYLRIGGWLLMNKKIVDSEHRRWFWAGLHRKFRKRVEEHMRIMDPQLDDSEPFKIDAVVKAAKRMYNRERFDEEELTLYGGEEGSDLDLLGSDSDSDDDSSTNDSGEEDSDEESDNKKSAEWKKRMKKKPTKKKPVRPTKPVKAGTKENKAKDEDVDELVEGMMKLDISEPKYFTKWLQLIRKAPELESAFRRPEVRGNAVIRPDFDARTRPIPPHLSSSNLVDREGGARGFGPKCYGCGQFGHPASRCEEINKYIREGVIERNEYGRLQWKGGTPLRREENESFVEAIQRNKKMSNLIMVAQKDQDATNKYTYLHTERADSDADSDEQEEVWLGSMDSDIFEAESYGVQRTQKMSRGLRRTERDQYLRVKPNPTDNRTGRNKLEEDRTSKQTIDPNLGGKAPNVGNKRGGQRPVDVHKDVFDPKNDDDLVPMNVDEVGKDDEGEKQRNPVARGLDGGTREVRKGGPNTKVVPDQLVKDILRSPLTIDLGTLLGIAPAIKRGLVTAVRDTTGNPAPVHQTRNSSMLSNAAVDGEKRVTSGPVTGKKSVNLARARDDLMKIRVYVGEAKAVAIVDTGSQLNLMSELKFSETGLLRTEDNDVSVTGATGGGNTCIGKIPDAEIYIASEKVTTNGPEIHILEDPPFEMLLGRPWLTGNNINIEEREEGTCLTFKKGGKNYMINSSPNPMFQGPKMMTEPVVRSKRRQKETFAVVTEPVGRTRRRGATGKEDLDEAGSEVSCQCGNTGREGEVCIPAHPDEESGSSESEFVLGVHNDSGGEDDEDPEDGEGGRHSDKEKEMYDSDEEQGKREIKDRARRKQVNEAVHDERTHEDTGWDVYQRRNNAYEGYHTLVSPAESQTLSVEQDRQWEDEDGAHRAEHEDSEAWRWDLNDEDEQEGGEKREDEEMRRASYGKQSRESNDQDNGTSGSQAEETTDGSDPSDEKVGRTETNVRTHEEIINLIRAGISNEEWEAGQERERGRAKAGNLRWEAMKTASRNDEWDDQGAAALDDESMDVEPTEERNTPAPSRKRKAVEGELPTAKEHVMRRSQRTKKVTYKATQPEYMRLMRKTARSDESAANVEPPKQRKKQKNIYSLMLKVTKKGPTENRCFTQRAQQNEGTSSGDLNIMGKDRSADHKMMNDMIRNEGVPSPQEHEDIVRQEWDEWGRESDEHEVAKQATSNPSSHGKTRGKVRYIGTQKGTRAEGKSKRRNIKGRMIGLDELTNPESYERYWHSGLLRPHTSLFIDARDIPMIIPPTPFLPRVYLPTSPSTYDASPQTNRDTLYPPRGLQSGWNGIVLVGTSVDGMFKRVLKKDHVQTIITTVGTTFVVGEPQMQGRHIFRGRATIIFDATPTNYAPEVPHPDVGVMSAFWDDLFRPQRPAPPFPLDMSPPDGLVRPSDRPELEMTTTGGVVSTSNPDYKKEDCGLPHSLIQTAEMSTNSENIGDGTKEDPIDVDEWIRAIESSLVVTRSTNPFAAAVASNPPPSGPSHDGRKGSKGGDVVMGQRVSSGIRYVYKRNSMNLPVEQENEVTYEADNEGADTASIASTESEVSDAEFLEMEELLRPPNPEPFRVQDDTDDSNMTDVAESATEVELERGVDEDLEEGEIAPKKKIFYLGVDKLSGYTTVTSDIADARLPSKWEAPVTALTDSTDPKWAYANALARTYAPEEIRSARGLPTPPSSVPSLAASTTSSSTTRTWGSAANPVDDSQQVTVWDNPTFVTVGQLNEVQRQVTALDARLSTYFPDTSTGAAPPWEVPYVTWDSHTFQTSHIYDIEKRLIGVKELVDAHQIGFEAYQKEISEQLDRRFKGLRDAQSLKIRLTDDLVARVEERVMKSEVREVILNERLTAVRIRLQRHQDTCTKDVEQRQEDLKTLVSSLETQIAILSEIAGIPTFLSTPDIPRVTEHVARDPRRMDITNDGVADQEESNITQNKYIEAVAP